MFGFIRAGAPSSPPPTQKSGEQQRITRDLRRKLNVGAKPENECGWMMDGMIVRGIRGESSRMADLDFYVFWSQESFYFIQFFVLTMCSCAILSRYRIY